MDRACCTHHPIDPGVNEIHFAKIVEDSVMQPVDIAAKTRSYPQPKTKKDITTSFNKLLQISSILFIVCMAFRCNDVGIAGGTIETTNGNTSVTCAATTSTGVPAAYATVRLRRTDYIAKGNRECIDNQQTYCKNTTADSSGRICIDSVFPGNYRMEIYDTNINEAVLVTVSVNEIDTHIEVSPITLDTTASIRGTLSFEGAKGNGTVYLFGIERKSRLDTNGTFMIHNLPAGSYTIHFEPDTFGYASMDIPIDTVESGRSKDIGTVSVRYQGCPDYTCDSLAVLSIIKANNLSINDIHRFVSIDANTNRITRINLQNQNIKHLPSEIGNVRMLTELYLSDNELRELPPELGNCTLLKKVVVTNNELSLIPPTVGKLDSLEVLSAENNYLTEIPKMVNNLKKLTKLGLANNHIQFIPSQLCSLPSLQELYINGNQLTELPESIGNLKSLTVLVAGNNFIDTMPASIGNLTALQRLDLNDNNLSTLPATIGNCVNIEHMLINANQLTSLPILITNLTNIKQLMVNGNKLCEEMEPELETWISAHSQDQNWKDTQCE